MPRYDLMHWSQRIRDQQATRDGAVYAPAPLGEVAAPRLRKPRRQAPKPTPNPDADHVLRLCQDGRLYELEQWAAAGKSLAVPSDYKKKRPLRVALRAGFHSLIEFLLKHETDPHAKNDALVEACRERQTGAVELALQYGADPKAVSFLDALLAWNRQIVVLLLDHDADITTNYPFTRAFQFHIRTALGCYLECRRRRPELADQLQEQADMALRQACSEENLKWVSLLSWVGANPRSKGLTLDDLNDPEIAGDPESQRSALQEACLSGHLDIVKRLKPDPARDDLTELLTSASTFAKADVMAYLIALGAKPNDKPNGGSSALDACLRYVHWEESYLFHPREVISASSLTKSRTTVRLLLESGALWRPDASIIADVRKVLYHIDPEVIIEFVERLRFHQACDETVLHELLRTPKMQAVLRAYRRTQCDAKSTVGRLRPRGTTQRADAPAPPPRLTVSAAYYLGRYNRERLYEEVWSAPTQRVARQYGVTDVAIAKACTHLNIPKPPRGYWAKKDAGVRVPPKPPLPILVDHREP